VSNCHEESSFLTQQGKLYGRGKTSPSFHMGFNLPNTQLDEAPPAHDRSYHLLFSRNETASHCCTMRMATCGKDCPFFIIDPHTGKHIDGWTPSQFSRRVTYKLSRTINPLGISLGT